MLSLGKLAAGQQQYYEAEVARGLEEYYSGEKEAPGEWMGAAAGRLGLEGEVGSVDFERVLSHEDPATGAPLACGRVQPKVVGFDATFSAPKSVSLLYGVGSPEVSNEVRNAHDAAVAAAVSVLEVHAAVGRRGAAGCWSVAGEGLVGAAFRHRTSRAGDPQLHTHVVVPNLVQAASDGRWSALDAARGLYPWARPVGHLYEAQLRWELTRRLGVGWGPVRNGIAEVDGIPRPVLEEFSTRRREISDHLAERVLSSARSAQIAAYATRRAKDRTTAPHSLFEEWRAKAAALGVTATSLDGVCHRSSLEPPVPGSPEAAALFAVLAGPEGVTARRSTFTYGRLLEAVCDRLPGGGRVEDVVALADGFLRSGHVVELDPGEQAVARRADGRPIPGLDTEPRWTTQEMVATEQRVLDAVARGQGAQAGTVRPDLVQAALARRPELAGEQSAMVEHLCGSGNGVDVVIGLAGAGKTTALAIAADAWRRAGYRVTGAALAARTALALQEATGAESLTMVRLLGRLDRGELVLTLGDVVLVDEAGMVGTRHLARLVDHADGAGAKLVLIGDPRQLPELDAGGTLRALEHRTGAVALTVNRRQQQPWERRALADFRHGNPAHALAAYRTNDRIHTTSDGDALRADLVAAWATDRRCGAALMVAGTRAEVEDLNRRARTLLQQTGEVGPDQVTLAGRCFAVGDTVLALRNDPAAGLLNGTRGRLEQIDTRRQVLVVRTDHDRGTVGVPFRYGNDGHLAHGYAMTVHKAQGVTADTCRVLVGDAMTREQLYTALSRGRSENHLYLEDPDRRALDRHARELTPTADQVLQSAVQRSGSQHMAIDDHGDRLVPHSALQAEQQRLQQIRSAQPHDPRRQLLALAEERQALRRQLSEINRTKTNVCRQLNDLGPFGRYLHSRTHATLEGQLRQLDNVADVHADRLGEVQAQRDQLQPALRRWTAWHADHKHDLDRLSALNLHIGITAALKHRPQERLLENRPPGISSEPPDMELSP